MSLPRALAIPAALVVVLTVVGAWVDGSRSAATTSPTAPTLPVDGTLVASPTTLDPAATAAAPTTSVPPVAAAPGATSCTSVVHIGDSTSVGLMDPSFIADPPARIDAQYARVGVTDFRDEIKGARSIVEHFKHEENADDVATRQKAAGYEGCWVLALGTTDAANMAAGGVLTAAERIDRMFSIIGDDPVLWVNVKTQVADPDPWANSQMVAWDAALTAAVARHPNLRVYDWASVVQDSWFQDDGIHYNQVGNAERARDIADALATAYPA